MIIGLDNSEIREALLKYMDQKTGYNYSSAIEEDCGLFEISNEGVILGEWDDLKFFVNV